MGLLEKAESGNQPEKKEQEEGREETPCQGRTNPAEEEGGSKEGTKVLPPQG